MQLDWTAITRRAMTGEGITEDEAQAIAGLTDDTELQRLFEVADAVRFAHKRNEVYTCGITNAKSGRCPEKCNFCSQSAHFQKAESPVYGLKDAETIAQEAELAAAHGVREFSIVTQGRAVTKRTELDELKKAFSAIRERTGMQTCASLGLMSKEHLAELRDAGMDAFHHNLETARSFHDQVVESHSYDEELASIRAAKELGMYVCSGGIFGMGESWEQRVEMGLELRALDVDSVPLNFLNPRPGTPFAELDELDPTDCLKIVALYRLMLPTKDLIVCGGREANLGERQYDLFHVGANGIMLGNYLTTAGTSTDQDLEALEARGLQIRPTPHEPAERVERTPQAEALFGK